MDKLTDMLILFSFLVEAGVLVYLERRIWNTLFTPLVFMILPYTLVLLVTIAVSGNMGFVQFYYPSILFWSVGSIIFFIPSLILGYYYNRKIGLPVHANYNDFELSSAFIWFVRILCLLFVYRFWTVLHTSDELFGSEDFGTDFAGGGLWGHLRELSCAFLALFIYKVDKQHRSYFFYIFIFLLVGLFYQVKGWIIIPCVAGLATRLITGKLKLRLGLVVRTIVLGFLLFQVSYILSFTVGGEEEQVTWYMVEWVAKHFFHYFTSGTFGLSVDTVNGFPDCRSFEVLLAPFYNVYATLAGEELISPVNPIYYNPGLNLTNVRTFWGTVYINGSLLSGISYSLVLSSWIYGSMIVALVTRHLMFLLCYLFSCSLLAMGWFEFYFFHLSIIEIPFYFCLIFLLSRCRFNYSGKGEVDKFVDKK